jgi:Undecaprenyl-phosphate galactose phosphotransferase WbaP
MEGVMTNKNKERLLRRGLVFGMAFADYLALLCCCIAAVFIWSFINPELKFSTYIYLPVFIILFNFIFAGTGLYDDVYLNRVVEFKKLTLATFIGFVIFLSFTFFLRNSEDYSRGAVILATLFSIIFLPYNRAFYRKVCYKRNLGLKKTVIFGHGKRSYEILRYLYDHISLGYKPILWVDAEQDPEYKIPSDVECFSFDDYFERERNRFQDDWMTAILVAEEFSEKQKQRMLEKNHVNFENIILVPNLLYGLSVWSESTDLGGIIGLEIPQLFLKRTEIVIKRVLDLLLIIISSPILLFLMGFLALLIIIDSPGGAFYKQKRIGLNGELFSIYKFRTMVVDAEEKLNQLLEADPEKEKEYEIYKKLKDDPRVTRVGRILRALSFDELPQLINVLLGDMSLVGPRPLLPSEIVDYGENIEFYKRIKPGLTGLWQVSGRNDVKFYMRAQLDLNYFRNWSVWFDFYILTRTPIAVFRKHGAY